MARLAGFEPTASASAGLRSIHLSYKRTKPILILVTCVTMIPEKVVPKGRFSGSPQAQITQEIVTARGWIPFLPG